jgi:hypothetical protein
MIDGQHIAHATAAKAIEVLDRRFEDDSEEQPAGTNSDRIGTP